MRDFLDYSAPAVSLFILVGILLISNACVQPKPIPPEYSVEIETVVNPEGLPTAVNLHGSYKNGCLLQDIWQDDLQNLNVQYLCADPELLPERGFTFSKKIGASFTDEERVNLTEMMLDGGYEFLQSATLVKNGILIGEHLYFVTILE